MGQVLKGRGFREEGWERAQTQSQPWPPREGTAAWIIRAPGSRTSEGQTTHTSSLLGLGLGYLPLHSKITQNLALKQRTLRRIHIKAHQVTVGSPWVLMAVGRRHQLLGHEHGTAHNLAAGSSSGEDSGTGRETERERGRGGSRSCRDCSQGAGLQRHLTGAVPSRPGSGMSGAEAGNGLFQ